MVADERYFMIYCIVYRYLCTSKIETITLTIMNKSSKLSIIPVMLCFFAMGFVDLVGIASNYVKEDLNLNDATANLFPSLVFFWFLIFSVPTGILMNKIGRKKTVLLSLLVTVISLLLPIFGENFELMLVSFSLLGIGNALMQHLPEPSGFGGDIRSEPGIHIDLRSVCQGDSFLPGSIHRYVGCHGKHSNLRSGLESSLPNLYGYWNCCNILPGRYTY